MITSYNRHRSSSLALENTMYIGGGLLLLIIIIILLVWVF